MIKKITDYIKIKFLWITLERFPNLYRPSSKPYISGDSLRNSADHIFDESKSINTNEVKENDIIFLNSDLIEVFFNVYDKNINERYILITHNSDRNIGEFEIAHMSKNVIHWYAQNLLVEENKNVSFIPIGLENLRRLKSGRKRWFKKAINKKTKLILSSFNIFTNYKVRLPAQNFLNTLNFIDTKEIKSTKNYFDNLTNYMFVICPEGNGADTHRIWESLLLNVIPIVIDTPFSKNLKNNSIPCLYLKDWDDLQNYSETDLIEIYKKLSRHNVAQFSTFEYWFNKIKDLN